MLQSILFQKCKQEYKIIILIFKQSNKITSVTFLKKPDNLKIFHRIFERSQDQNEFLQNVFKDSVYLT